MSDEGYSVQVSEGYDEAVVRTRLALRAEGFSVITEMHVGGLLGPEAGDAPQYLIMGAWAPPASNRVLDADIQVAVHIPCNFVIHEAEGSAIVATLDPGENLEEQDQQHRSTADAMRAALQRVFDRITAGA
ncbi:MAG: DUF302 domain-containing protein [Actinomycetota bacterium]